MNFCVRKSFSSIRCIVTGLSLVGSMLVWGVAAAVAPVINTAPITLTLPANSAGVNLRQLGVLTGSAPLTITGVQILVNNQTTSVLSSAIFPVGTPGQVCISITNIDFSPQIPQTVALRLSVTNPQQQSAGPINVPVIFGAGQTPNLATCGDPNTRPTANPGPNRTVADTDGSAGELVVLDGGLSADADVGSVLTYEWRSGQGVLLAPASTTPQLTTRLPDGVNTVSLTVTDDSGDAATASATSTVQITVSPALQAPTVSAGQNRTVADTDKQPGETVTLTATGSDPDGQIQSFVWYLSGEFQIGTGATIQASLPDGVSTVTVVATDNDQQTAFASVQITVAAPAILTVDAGLDRTVADTDGAPGEAVTLTGTASASGENSIASYQWLLGTTSLGSGATLQTRLPDGVNTVTLLATDSAGNTGTDIVQITVTAALALPVVNAGADRVIADTDREVGETVTLVGSATTPAGTIVSFQWLLGTQVLGATATLQARLPDGVNIVTLRVTNSLNIVATDTVQITVSVAPQRVSLAALPNLSGTGKSVASALDRICTNLDQMGRTVGTTLTADEQALRTRCDSLYFGNTVANQVDAIGELVTDDFAVARTQTLLFANTQYASVMDRLMALRGGARGLSLAGLNIMVDGQYVPLAQVQQMAKDLLGGGASGDATEPGGLLSDKWGMWARGNYSFGKKDANATSPSFDADQWSMVGGIDYRLSDQAVIGGSLAYGNSSVDFSSAAGSLDSASWAGSVYGSVYAGKNFYLDAIVNFANADYDADRNITYVDGSGLVAGDAKGSTDGLTISGGVSGGYDFLVGGITLSPTLGFYYIDATIDSFTENGVAGLNLKYDEQNFKSLTGNLGFRATYAINLTWGVLLPHVRIDYVREFENDVDVFGVRFAADPNANSAPPILVQTDNPDESYWRLAGGFSAQFKFGFSGYIEYQRLQSFEFISFQDVSVGLRMQRSF